MILTRENILNFVITAGLILVPIYAVIVEEPFTITLATRAVIFSLAAVGLNIALGLGGMVSLGHAVFFGIGGYTMGILAFHAQSYIPLFEWPILIEGTKQMLVVWPLAMIISAIAAFFIGLLSLRTGGVYFIMITLAFGQMFFFFSISWSAYGGEDGLSIYVRNQLPLVNTLVPIQFYAICLVILMLALWINARLAKSSFGLALSVARQNTERVRNIGLDPTSIKLVAFVISGAITGLAGALFADLNRFVSPTMFSWQLSGEIMVFIIIGGIGRLYGPVLGAIIFVTLEHFLGGISEYWLVFLGLLLLLIVLFSRGGLVGLLVGREHVHE